MNIKLFLFAALALAYGNAYAGDTDVTNTSNSSVNSAATATSNNGGLNNTQNFITNNPDKLDYRGGYSIRNVPSVALGAFGNSFSSDYCSGTMQASVGVAGFGAAAGKQKLDEGCQLLRTTDMLMRMEGAIRAEAAAAWNFSVELDRQREQAIKAVGGNVSVDQANYINNLAKNARDVRQLSFAKAEKADQLEDAAIFNICSISETIKNNLVSAGISCPKNK